MTLTTPHLTLAGDAKKTKLASSADATTPAATSTVSAPSTSRPRAGREGGEQDGEWEFRPRKDGGYMKRKYGPGSNKDGGRHWQVGPGSINANSLRTLRFSPRPLR